MKRLEVKGKGPDYVFIRAHGTLIFRIIFRCVGAPKPRGGIGYTLVKKGFEPGSFLVGWLLWRGQDISHLETKASHPRLKDSNLLVVVRQKIKHGKGFSYVKAPDTDKAGNEGQMARKKGFLFMAEGEKKEISSVYNRMILPSWAVGAPLAKTTGTGDLWRIDGFIVDKLSGRRKVLGKYQGSGQGVVE